MRLAVRGENRHEELEPEVAERYPDGMHGMLAAGISKWLGIV